MKTYANNPITCSIIIAHKNIPDLLVRCLASIPPRKDIQLIVVDDNSNPSTVDFNHFPGLDREGVEVYFTHKSGGTGFAQNVGLQYALGKWVTFLGADDFFTEDFSSFLDEIQDADEDLIVFDHRSVLSDDPSIPVVRSNYLSKLIRQYRQEEIDENFFRCRYIVATCKLIKLDLINKYNIRFNETRWSNDNYFSAQVSCYANKIRVCDDIIYVMSVRNNSLTSNFVGTRQEAEIRLQEAIKSDKLYIKHGLTDRNVLSDATLMAIMKRHGYWKCWWFCLTYITNWPVFTTLFKSLVQKTIHHFGGRLP